jgi:hypothetical protein
MSAMRTRFPVTAGVLLAAVCLAAIAAAQTAWTRTCGGPDPDEGSSVQQTTDGGYVVAGHTGVNVYLIRTDAQGDTLTCQPYSAGWPSPEPGRKSTESRSP